MPGVIITRELMEVLVIGLIIFIVLAVISIVWNFIKLFFD